MGGFVYEYEKCVLGITLAYLFLYVSYVANNPLHEKQQHLHAILLHNKLNLYMQNLNTLHLLFVSQIEPW